MRKEDARRLMRVGVAMLVSIAVLIGVIALLGQSRGLFASRVSLHTSFRDINGLVVGAPVRLAGLDIGVVQDIRFDREPTVKTVHVTMRVQRQYLPRIREDSIARLSSKGLLGDMIINIDLGSADLPQLQPGAHMRSQENQGLGEIIDSLHRAIGGVTGLAADADERLKKVLTDDVARDLGRAARSSANMLEKVEKGDGLLHALIYRPELARDAAGLVQSGRITAERLQHAAGRLEQALATLQSGPGALHDLVYGPKGQRLLDSLLSSTQDLSQLLAEVRSGDGLLHEVIYEDDAAQLGKDLAQTARILRTLAEETQAGKGTVGALIKDPTVYEDLKTTLGSVSRSKLLRALIRYAIKKDALSR